MDDRSTVGVLGAGAWGTALALIAARRGHRVRLWGRKEDQIEDIQRTRRSPRFLDAEFPTDLEAVTAIEDAVTAADLILVVTASPGVRSTVRAMAPHYPMGVPIVTAAKGLEVNSRLRMSQVIREELGDRADVPVCALSGPNFAVEIVSGLPAGTVVAADNEEWARRVQQILSGPVLRIYTSDDLLGVELGGALKNIYAIGTGLVHSLGLGYNLQATLITRGLAELGRLGVRMGAHPLTFAGLSGLGDLILTCTSDLSRNRRAGLALGQGRSNDEVLAEIGTVEGLRSAHVAAELAAVHGVDMPIVSELNQVLHHGKPPMRALECLMERAGRTERDEEFI